MRSLFAAVLSGGSNNGPTTTNTMSTRTPAAKPSPRTLNIAGLIADTVHHEVKLVRYTEHVARYHGDSSDDDDSDLDDRKSEKEVQRFFERDWDQQDWDADAEVWEEPDWSQRVREDRRLTNSRKEARI